MRNFDAVLALFMARDVPFVFGKCTHCVLHHVLATVFPVRPSAFLLLEEGPGESTF